MKKIGLSVVLISGALTLAQANGFQSIGYENIGMGNTGVANSKGSFTSYYNPALLGKEVDLDNIEFSSSFGVGIQDQNVIKNVDNFVNKYEITNTIDSINNAISSSNTSVEQKTIDNVIGLQETISNFQENTNLNINPNINFAFQFENFSIGVFSQTNINMKFNIDKNYNQFIVQNGTDYIKYNVENNNFTTSNETEYNSSSLEYALDNKVNNIQVQTFVLTEIPLSYGNYINTEYGKVHLGGSLKYMNGTTYSDTMDIDKEVEDVQDYLDSNMKSSVAAGVDLGIAYQPINELTIGLSAKNINAPEFKTLTNEKVKLDMSSRIGIAYRAFDMIDFAVDYDLTKNDRMLTDIKEQYVGLGVNFNPMNWFSLRGGYMKNLAEDSEGNIFTAGLGFGMKWLQFDVSGQMSGNKTVYDGQDIPKDTRINFGIISRW